MKKAILATKVGMTQIFNEDGILTPVTVLQAGPCVVTQVKTVENDGYEAVQVGFVDKREKLVNKPVRRATSTRLAFPTRDMSESSRFENAAEYARKAMRSRLTSSQQAIRLMQLLFPKVKDSRAPSRDMASTEDLWLTVPSSIVIRVPTVPATIPARVFKGKGMPGHMGHVKSDNPESGEL